MRSMNGRSEETRANQVPVSVISGFLGSGKTTLLNRLIQHPAMSDAALIVNEFGEIGIDHALVDSALENTVVMDSGCVCCTIRGDLMDTIDDLFAKADAGLLPRFSKILIEPTGLADPGPIVHALDQMEADGHPCRCNAVVTLVDGQQGLRQLDAHEEAARQIAAADVVLLSKPDLVPDGGLDALTQRISEICPGVSVLPVLHGDIDPDELFQRAAEAAARIPHASSHSPRGGSGHDHDGHRHHDHHDSHSHDASAHGDVRSLAISTDAPMNWPRLQTFFETVFSLRGESFLRVKGIVWADANDDPILIQGVGNCFSPPRRLTGIRDDIGKSRLVLIFKGLDAAAIHKTFERMVLRRPG